MSPEWQEFLSTQKEKSYYINLLDFLSKAQQQGKIIYPNQEDWFNALTVPLEKLSVIILGQDPYHGEKQAHGFSFSVPHGISIPPSLKNIFREIENEFGITMSKKNGNLIPWVEQGVMLLNTVLTVEKSKANSHKDRGWEILTDEIIKEISTKFSDKVFMLWGRHSIEKKNLIDENKHLVLTSAHPSPFSANKGFFGNNHFKIANDFLVSKGKNPINWQIKD